MWRIFCGLTLALSAALAQPLAAAELRLLMFEQPGCIYCARWDAEIAPQYPLTVEGKAAPLTRLQLRDDVPGDITLSRPATFTPTFVLLNDGHESGRIEGYPGEDFFWPMLAALIRDAGPGEGAGQ
ncbi:MAG: thioredoxin family protein [Pseudotabrizicola sp.]|uniref:thioredoxin family protein n=1 Tax=Pseudotabrizicola sp. TaxID=2939647 RepID=UPI0027261BE6|nr:thioredoxin family protein [Pseudotabrizicola sp.]MDO9638049.1 thioredoxin family protein [Pseudotabrizicola sp.]